MQPRRMLYSATTSSMSNPSLTRCMPCAGGLPVFSASGMVSSDFSLSAVASSSMSSGTWSLSVGISRFCAEGSSLTCCRHRESKVSRSRLMSTASLSRSLMIVSPWQYRVIAQSLERRPGAVCVLPLTREKHCAALCAVQWPSATATNCGDMRAGRMLAATFARSSPMLPSAQTAPQDGPMMVTHLMHARQFGGFVDNQAPTN